MGEQFEGPQFQGQPLGTQQGDKWVLLDQKEKPVTESRNHVPLGHEGIGEAHPTVYPAW